MSTPITKIVITACTYKRPQGLKDLFKSFKDLSVPDDIDLNIRIIDNEPDPAAKGLVEDLGKTIPWPTFYIHEKDPGIAPARNRALAEAKTDDYLVFVDDDETVSPQWISELWRVQNVNNAHFVQGPVTLTTENPENAWWTHTKLFALKSFPDHTPRSEAWSNNVMIDMSFVRKHNLQFDPSLRFDGGEDTLFFQTMTANGAKGVFAENATVYELQPESRLSWKWALTRQFRNGNTRAMIARRTHNKTKAIIHSIIRASGCAVVGIALLPSAIIKGRIGLANALTYIARSAGILWGMLGKQYEEYARPSSSNEPPLEQTS